MRQLPLKLSREAQRHNRAEKKAATSGFVRDALSESKSFVKEITRGKHTHSPVASSVMAKKHQYTETL